MEAPRLIAAFQLSATTPRFLGSGIPRGMEYGETFLECDQGSMRCRPVMKTAIKNAWVIIIISGEF